MIKIRMWNINPKVMCRKHLLGEHVELHMFVGCIKKGIKLNGYVNKGLVELHSLSVRHNELIEEMKKRGYNHKTPLEQPLEQQIGYVDSKKNLEELKNRCEECKKRMELN